MSAATVLTSAMAGMPVLNGTEGSLAALIRYIAPILGWSIEFDNGPVIVIRPQSYKGGQALFYRIDDRAARGGAAPRVAEVRVYETMSDINTGSGLVGPVCVHKSYYADTSAARYGIIGDSYGFILGSINYTGTFYNNAWSFQYFGFFNQFLSNDIPVCGAIGMPDAASNGSSVLLSKMPIVSNESSLIKIHKNRAGALNASGICYTDSGYQIQGLAIGSSHRDSSNEVPYKDYPYLNNIMTSSIKIGCGESPIIGLLPFFAFFHSANSNISFQLIEAAPSVVSPVLIDGRSLVLWRFISGSGMQNVTRIIVDIGEGFRP